MIMKGYIVELTYAKNYKTNNNFEIDIFIGLSKL